MSDGATAVTDRDIGSTPMLRPSVQQPLDIAPALDRLEWRHWRPAAQALLRGPKPTPGRRSQPVADGPCGSLQWGWDRDGHPVWIRTWFAGVPAGYDAVRTEAAHALGSLDAIVPPIVEAATAETVCLDRMRWAAPEVNHAHDIVRRFVESSLLDALASGRCVIAGEAHVLDDKRLVVEDIGGIFRLESVDRTVLFETVNALVAGSTTRLEALIAAATGGLDDHRRWVAKRCAAGLIVEWSSLGFTLALRDVARTLLVSGSTHAGSLCAIADEVAHRMDLAHRYRCPCVFASATAVDHLLEQAA